MNAPIRPSQPRVPPIVPTAPVQNQFYVFSADNNHVGPVNAELIARGVVAGRVSHDAFIAPTGSTNWVPIASIQEIADAIQKERSTPSSMRPTSLGAGAPTVVTPPPPPMPRDLMAGPTVAAPTSGNSTVMSPNPFAPNPPTQLSPAAQQPTSQPPPPPPPNLQPPVPAYAAAAQPASVPAPPAQPASIPAQPVASPLAPSPAPSPSIAPAPPASLGDPKKEEKKPALDPRFKLLPLVIFGACAFIGVVETAIVLIAR